MLHLPRAMPIIPSDEERFVTGGPCYICQKPLIPSLAAAPVMTKPLAKATRGEKLQREVVAKYLSKDIHSRSAADVNQINRFLPPDPKSQVIAVSCGHLFHRNCFREYSQKYKLVKRSGMIRCPLCRKFLLVGDAVCVDFRPIDCGHDKLPLPYGKEIQALEKEGVDMRDAYLKARFNYSRAFRIYLEQMFKLKNYKREITEYYKPFWTKAQNIELLRERRASLQNEASARVRENLDKAAVFLTKLEDGGLPPDAMWTILKLRRSREGLDSFRSLATALKRKNTDRTTGELNILKFKEQLIQILCRGFDFP